MPFETGTNAPKRIAVIGGGISGMSAAHMLSGDNAVVLFEAEGRLGGHARTIFAGKNRQPVDTGFLVFNNQNYPYLTALFHDLGVPIIPSDMSWGCSIKGGWMEYGLLAPSAVFAQKRNLLRPNFLRMLRDCMRFNSQADAFVTDPDMTVGEMIAGMGLGDWFRDYYLLPFSGAIWSTPVSQITEFPARAMLDFFKNHALMHHTGQHEWQTVQGGSIEYVSRLEARMRSAGVDLRLGTPTDAVRRTPLGVEVKAKGGEWEPFDEVVFATHSDITLKLLSDASLRERAALGDVAYQPNEAILHSDANVMPKRRAAWGSWNYTEVANKTSDKIDLTYWINLLQKIPGETDYFVTLNSQQPIRDEFIHDTYTFHHPVFDGAALKAQEAIKGFNGTNRTWFCGAWMRNGFHEDGIHSAVQVVEAMQVAKTAKVAAE